MLGRRLVLSLARPSGWGSVQIARCGRASSKVRFQRAALARRFFATPGRPKGAVGEATRPIKRARKTGTTSTKTTSTKKTSKSGAKKSASPKKKKKATPKKKAAPKPLTEEQKASRKARADKLAVRELKKLALDPPFPLRTYAAWSAFFTDKTIGSGQVTTPDMMKDLSRQYKAMAPAELEHYNQLARAKTEASEAKYNDFLAAHTPAELDVANRARAKLRRLAKAENQKVTRWRAIEDPRLPSKPTRAFTQFTKDRFATGDLKHIPITEAGKLLASEWKALDNFTKQQYVDRAAHQQRQYHADYEAVVGATPGARLDRLAA